MVRLSALLGTLALVLVACTGDAAQACERLPNVRPGLCVTPEDDREPAPTGPGPVLGSDGDEASVTDGDGRLVVMNFWGSWCAPCRTEQPELNELAALLGDEAVFLGVNVQDPATNALAYVDEFEVPYPSIHDPSGTYAAAFGGIGPRVMPSTVLIDTEGRVAVTVFGATTLDELSVLASEIIAGDQGAADDGEA